MRSLSYVQLVSLDFTGTLFPRAICLGQADNDSLNELIVGDTSGKLHVYKNNDSKPWITRTCVGMLTCVGVGDICNNGRNFVVAVGAEGWFHLFDLSAVEPSQIHPASRRRCSLTTRNPASLSTFLPALKSSLLVTLMGMGAVSLPELWTAGPAEEVASGGTGSLSVNPDLEGLPELMVSQPGCGSAILLCTWTQQDSSEAGPGEEAPPTPGSLNNTLDAINKFKHKMLVILVCEQCDRVVFFVFQAH
ncbi:unnamed protein product [Oncorhynchus mykiss]|uniref:Integrin alpha FG-GAP repeat containing 2 n=1 Tax=Oncorhynchus mykiss TaxID=8022 RepID=A0A060XR04_ONCMY|nr:unnamed protein product [Oncorhynchus mykiss]